MLEEKIDGTAFAEAVERARARDRRGVGTLDEKLLHAAVKNYFSPADCQEVKIGGYIADACVDGRILEVQTGSCFPLKKKLRALLPGHEVRVVCPLMRKRTLYWIDPDTGGISAGRRSPKTGALCDLLPELLYIDEFINEARFLFTVFLYDGEEYRLQNGWGSEGKRGARRAERLPVSPVRLITIENAHDYAALLPTGLPGQFSSSDFSRLTRQRGRRLWASLKILSERGLLIKQKEGNRVYYSMNKEYSDI